MSSGYACCFHHKWCANAFGLERKGRRGEGRRSIGQQLTRYIGQESVNVIRDEYSTSPVPLWTRMNTFGLSTLCLRPSFSFWKKVSGRNMRCEFSPASNTMYGKCGLTKYSRSSTHSWRNVKCLGKCVKEGRTNMQMGRRHTHTTQI